VRVTQTPQRTDVLVVGAGPAGSAAAAWAARDGRDVVLADAAVFPRDKTCGDGLTPRAIGELRALGLEDWLRARTVNRGLRAHGFGQTLMLPWPGGSLPDWGSAAPRTELDARIRQVALDDGAIGVEGAKAIDARVEGGRVRAVTFRGADGTFEIECERLVVADGVRSGLGKVLGREWHKDTVHAVAGRCYVDSTMADDPWISSHLELRGTEGEILSGYGWIFPLGGGQVNVGVGSLATTKRPADIAIRPVMTQYTDARRRDFGLSGEQRMPASALLPMGGAVSHVAGPNWALVGDAAACINPLNGEGIDYGLETGRLAAESLDEVDLQRAWPALLQAHYARGFSVARRLGLLLTLPRFLPLTGPAAMRSATLMGIAVRVMGNLVTSDDTDLVARAWRRAGGLSRLADRRKPFS
jgi:geranylgeranyl reductase family protein